MLRYITFCKSYIIHTFALFIRARINILTISLNSRGTKPKEIAITNHQGRAFVNEMPFALPEYRLRLIEAAHPEQWLQPGIYWRKSQQI